MKTGPALRLPTTGEPSVVMVLANAVATVVGVQLRSERSSDGPIGRSISHRLQNSGCSGLRRPAVFCDLKFCKTYFSSSGGRRKIRRISDEANWSASFCTGHIGRSYVIPP